MGVEPGLREDQPVNNYRDNGRACKTQQTLSPATQYVDAQCAAKQARPKAAFACTIIVIIISPTLNWQETHGTRNKPTSEYGEFHSLFSAHKAQ